jgi:2-phospho-L-lactate guanylyltransferase
MMWTVVVPINYGGDCKTRLAARLTRAQRVELVERMARHVFTQLEAVPSIREICVLSAVRPAFGAGHWIADEGRGLNAELEAVRAFFSSEPLAFIHADLPFLEADDVTALLEAAAHSGAAIAPDLQGVGTNALALAQDRTFSLAFGPDSFSKHSAALPDAAIVRLRGLAFDLDNPAELDLAAEQGFPIPQS